MFKLLSFLSETKILEFNIGKIVNNAFSFPTTLTRKPFLHSIKNEIKLI